MNSIKKTILIAPFLVVLLLQFSCAEEKKSPLKKEVTVLERETTNTNCLEHILKNKENNLNISVFLDLSDRIEETKTQEKDAAYLSSLSKSFVNHIKAKKLIMLEDRMQLFFNPEPSNEKINEIATKLKVAFTRETAKAKINETLLLYAESPSELYDFARDDAKKANGYPGSDIWRFFKDDVKDYCIDDCHRNILVILTDGYMFHNKTVMEEKNRTSYLTPKSLGQLQLNKSSWLDEMTKKDIGFIPANTELNNLEVLVIGITSHNNQNAYAQDVIEAYWSKWFEEMGVKKYKIKNADIPSSIETVISDFILKS